MNAHSSTPKAKDTKNPTQKTYLKDQGPAIRGNRLVHTTSSAGRFKLPEATE